MNGCDPNCCCDVDCSASDKESFTKCSETKNVMYVHALCSFAAISSIIFSLQDVNK